MKKLVAVFCLLLLYPITMRPVVRARDLPEPPPPHHVVAPLALDVDATARVAKSGPWSSAETWENGKPPAEWGRVVVPAGTELTLDLSAPTLHWMRVDGRFKTDPSKNTLLPIDSLFVNMGGAMDVPCTPQGVSSVILFRPYNKAPINQSVDPTELGRGLVAEGPVTMCGAEKTSWAVVTKPPIAGSKVVEVDRALLNWNVGDRVLLTGPTYGTDVVRRIESISEKIVTFDQPVKIDYNANLPAGESIHIGNLTRNVKVESEVKGDSRMRGHVMLMGGGHSIKYVEFDHTGRTNLDAPTDPILRDVTIDGITNKVRDPQLFPLCVPAANKDANGNQRENVRGRYPLHVHRPTPFAAKSVIQGVSLHGPRNAPRQHALRWGITNHSAHTDILDNVVHQIDGIGIQSGEEGNEVGDVQGNLVVYSNGLDTTLLGQPADPLCMIRNYLDVHQYRRMAHGSIGSGIWTQSGGMRIIANIISSHTQGLSIVTSDLGNAPRADKTNFKVMFPIKLYWGNLLSDPAFHASTWAINPLTGSPVEEIPVTDTPTFIKDNYIYGGRKTKQAHDTAVLYQTHQNRTYETFPKVNDSIHHGTRCYNVESGMLNTYTSQLDIRNFHCKAGVYKGSQQATAMAIASQGRGRNSIQDSSFEGFTLNTLRLSGPNQKASCGPNVTTDGQNAKAIIGGVAVDCTTTAPATQKVKIQRFAQR